jgi:hypothetical protein
VFDYKKVIFLIKFSLLIMQRDSQSIGPNTLYQDLLSHEALGKDDAGSKNDNHNLATHMAKFKQSFIVRIVFGLFAFFAILFQIFFYSKFYHEENKLIVDIQSVLLGDERSNILRFLSYAIQPFYIHLAIMHLVLTIFYGTDCILGLKLIVNNLIIFTINKVVLLLHQEPRPYWLNPDNRAQSVDGYGCVTEYSNPDMSVIQLLVTSVNFLLMDTQLKKLRTVLHIPPIVPYITLLFGLLVFVCLYIGGQAYLSHFVISVIYTFLYYQILAMLNPWVSIVIRKCTFEAKESFRGRINYFMLFLISVVGEALLLIGYNSRNQGPKAIFNYVVQLY